jgi:DNA adenine methylase
METEILITEIKPLSMSYINSQINFPAKPFLRWAGGKRWLTKHIKLISKLEINDYFEPFLGGGSVFFNLQNYSGAHLSDLNQELIETYQCLRKNPLKVITALEKYKNEEKEYYTVRNTSYEDIYDRAAKFIFLNKTSFNGIYRVNKSGVFNVPYGFRKNLDIIDKNNLLQVSAKLQNTEIECRDFFEIADKIQRGDLIFLDPPYTVAHENNGFIAYNQKIFSLDDQRRLSLLVEKIKDIGAYYVLTNAKHDAILDIYKKIDNPIILSRSSVVGGKGAKRETYNEYVFSNILY